MTFTKQDKVNMTKFLVEAIKKRPAQDPWVVLEKFGAIPLEVKQQVAIAHVEGKN